MTATQPPPTTHRFALRFSSTPRGARLARRMCGERLDAWGIPYGSAAHDALVLVAAELCANAVRHGHVAGRDFHVLLGVDPATGTVRIEVSDTRGERLPRIRATAPDDGGARPAPRRGARRPLGLRAPRGRARQDGVGGVRRTWREPVVRLDSGIPQARN
ncbi:ATP-binding protein [Streptomyces asoensis]|uniref:ATP-binding protein n=1 Tax=Streptomyces asoensis TaxID=249586 RepID=UPI0033C6AB8D